MSKSDILISVKNLTKKFNSLVAVNDITFDVKEQEIFAFLGPNGAGKTTTIKILTTLLDATSGQVEIAGFDVKNNAHEVRRNFGIVFQDPSVDEELTAYENMEIHGVLYGIKKDLRQKRIKELLTFVELWDRRKSFVKEFSGGMRRRLEIARGLLHHPKILFLDEPTIGLDPQTRNHIWNYIVKLNKKEKMTIFLTTHYMDEADRIADRIAIIDHGKIITQDTATNLKKQTKTESLEDAYLKITGSNIREESATSADNFRQHHLLRRKR